jgi:hypothetical protein
MDLELLLRELLSRLTDRLDITVTISTTKTASGPNTENKTIAAAETPEKKPNIEDTSEQHLAESMNLLERFGVVGEETLDHLAATYPTSRIRQCIAGIEAQNGTIKNRPAYLRKALECGYYKSNPYRKARK